MAKKAKKVVQKIDPSSATLATEFKTLYQDRYKHASHRSYLAEKNPVEATKNEVKENFHSAQQQFNKLSIFAGKPRLDISQLYSLGTKLSILNHKLTASSVTVLQESKSISHKQKKQCLYDAQQKYHKATKSLAEAYMEQGKHYTVAGKHNIALEFYQQARQVAAELNPMDRHLDKKICHKILNAYLLLNKNFESIVFCNEILQDKKDFGVAYYHLALAYFQQYVKTKRTHHFNQVLLTLKRADEQGAHIPEKYRKIISSIKDSLATKLSAANSETRSNTMTALNLGC
jgi:adenylate kinase family enzyme